VLRCCPRSEHPLLSTLRSMSNRKMLSIGESIADESSMSPGAAAAGEIESRVRDWLAQLNDKNQLAVIDPERFRPEWRGVAHALHQLASPLMLTARTQFAPDSARALAQLGASCAGAPVKERSSLDQRTSSVMCSGISLQSVAVRLPTTLNRLRDLRELDFLRELLQYRCWPAEVISRAVLWAPPELARRDDGLAALNKSGFSSQVLPGQFVQTSSSSPSGKTLRVMPRSEESGLAGRGIFSRGAASASAR